MWGMLTFVPFFHSLILGQDTALLFLGISLWYVGILRKQDKLTVAGLVLATSRPHICLALAIPLFFRNRRAWWLFVIFAGLLALANILLVGREGTLGFINLLQISAGGTWYGMNEQAMLNLSGLILRIFPSINLEILYAVRWVGYIAGIVFLCIVWMKVEKLDGRLLGITIISALLFAPHLHYHDLTLLIVPLVFIAIGPVTGRSFLSEYLVLLPFGISLLLIPKPFHYIAPYLLYLAIAWWMAKRPGTVESQNGSI